MRLSGLWAAVAWASTGLGCSTPPPSGVPIDEEPRHRLVSEMAFANVLDVELLGGDTTLYHVHARPIAYVCITGSALGIQDAGGEWAPPGEPCTPGTGSTNTGYATRVTTHRVANTGVDAFRVIGVQNLGAGSDGEWFDVRTVTLGQGAEDAAHRHDLPTLVVIASGAVASQVVGGRETLLLDPGTWVWVDAGSSHSMVNEQRAQARVVEIQVR